MYLTAFIKVFNHLHTCTCFNCVLKIRATKFHVPSLRPQDFSCYPLVLGLEIIRDWPLTYKYTSLTTGMKHETIMILVMK